MRTTYNINRAFKATLKRGAPEKHSLSRSAAYLRHALAEAGRAPQFCAMLLGHADVSLTLNVYSHVLPDMGDAAASAMKVALG
jgi:integrase